MTKLNREPRAGAKSLNPKINAHKLRIMQRSSYGPRDIENPIPEGKCPAKIGTDPPETKLV